MRQRIQLSACVLPPPIPCRACRASARTSRHRCPESKIRWQEPRPRDLRSTISMRSRMRSRAFSRSASASLAFRREAFRIIADLHHRIDLRRHESEPAIGLRALGAGLRAAADRALRKMIRDGQQYRQRFGEDLAFRQFQRRHLAAGLIARNSGFAARSFPATPSGIHKARRLRPTPPPPKRAGALVAIDVYMQRYPSSAHSDQMIGARPSKEKAAGLARRPYAITAMSAGFSGNRIRRSDAAASARHRAHRRAWACA